MKQWGLIPAILLCCILIAQPVMAQTVTYEAPVGKGIINIVIISQPDTTGTIEFTLNDGTTVSGSWSYITAYGGLTREATIEIGTESNSKTYITPGTYRVGYNLPGNVNSLSNTSTSRISVVGGQWDVPDINAKFATSASPVIKLTFVSDTDVSYDVRVLDMNTLNKNIQGSLEVDLCPAGNDIWTCDIMEFAYGAFDAVYAFLVTFLYWLKFFFVDNLLMTVTLYISVTMVFAARKAHGRMDIFFKTFFSDQKKLFSFIMELWKMLIESIGTVRGWFRV
jgi:hypothetical protein